MAIIGDKVCFYHFYLRQIISCGNLEKTDWNGIKMKIENGILVIEFWVPTWVWGPPMKIRSPKLLGPPDRKLNENEFTY